MAGKYLVEVDVKLVSNATQFADSIKSQLKSLDAAAKAPGMAPQSARKQSGQLQTAEGQTLAQLRANKSQMTPAQYKQSVKGTREAFNEQAKAQGVARPGDAAVLRSFDKAYRKMEPNLKKQEKAHNEMAEILQGHSATERKAAADSKAKTKKAEVEARAQEAADRETTAAKRETAKANRREAAAAKRSAVQAERRAAAAGVTKQQQIKGAERAAARDGVWGQPGGMRARQEKYAQQEADRREKAAARSITKQQRQQGKEWATSREGVWGQPGGMQNRQEAYGAAEVERRRKATAATENQSAKALLREQKRLGAERAADRDGVWGQPGGMQRRQEKWGAKEAGRQDTANANLRARQEAQGLRRSQQLDEQIRRRGMTTAERSREANAILTRRNAERIIRDQGASARDIQTGGARMVTSRERKDAEIRAANQIHAGRVASGDAAAGTWWQRSQAKAAERSGAPFRPATDYQTGRQYARQKFTSTAGFAASGAVLYGGLKLGGDILDEAGDLEQQLTLVKAAFEETGDAANKVTFEGYKTAIRGLSKDSGVAVSEVAKITRQLSGAFSDQETGAPNFDKALEEGDIALKFSKLTGLPQQEITDSLTAISLAFDTNFESIADSTTFLSRSFGVVETDIVRFTADLAPLGAELGFTAEQLSGLGAVAQQASGKTGTVLAEQFGRILPALQDKRAQLISLFQSNSATAGDIPQLTEAFATGNMDDVLKMLVTSYDKLTKSQKNALAGIVGGRREAAAFYAILDRGSATLRALGTDTESGKGEFDKRWKGYADTVQFAMTQLRRNVEDFGIALFQSGLGDGLKLIIQVMGDIANVAGLVFKAIGSLNSVFGGLPGKVAVAATALKLFSVMQGRVAAISSVSALTSWAGGLGRGVGGIRTAGAGYQPMVAPPMPTGWHAPMAVPPMQLAPGAQRAAASTTQFSDRRFSTYTTPTWMGSRVGGKTIGATANTQLGRSSVSGMMTRDAKGNIMAGGGTTAAAGVSGMGQLLNVAAPLVAIALVSKAKEKIAEYKAQMDTDLDVFGAKVKDALDRGLSPDEIRAELKDTTEESTLTKVAARVFTFEESAGEQMERREKDEVQAFYFPRQKEIAERIGTRPRGKIIKDLASASLDKKGYTDGYSEGGVKKTREQQRQEEAKRIAEVVKKYAESDGKTDKLENDFLEVLALDPENPELKKIVEDAGENFKDTLAKAEKVEADIKANEANAMKVAEATDKFSLGQVGVTQVLEAFTAQIDQLEVSLGGLDKGSDELAEVEQKIRDARKAQSEFFMNEIMGRSAFQSRIKGIGVGGETTGAEKYAAATKIFDEASAEGSLATDEAKANAALDALEARDAAHQEEIDNADTAAEKLRLTKEGPGPVPKAMQDAINKQVLGTGKGADYAGSFARLNFGDSESDLDEAKDTLVANYEQFGEYVNEADRWMLIAKREIVRAELATLKKLGVGSKPVLDSEGNQIMSNGKPVMGGDWGKYSDRLGALETEEKDLSTLIDDPGFEEGGVPLNETPEAKAKREADAQKAADEEARELGAKRLDLEFRMKNTRTKDPVEEARNEIERLQRSRAFVDPADTTGQEEIDVAIAEAREDLADTVLDEASKLADARSAIQKALAKGDPMKLALIALSDARRHRQEAKTDPEREMARAEELEAQFGIEEVAKDTEASRLGYLGALATDRGDTVGAAAYAQQSANAAVAAAADGTKAKWDALAQKVSADRTMRDALLASFAAQQDLAASLFESVNDAVGVAETQLKVARANYDDAVARGVNGSDLDPFKAALNRAQTSYGNAARDDRMSDLDYLFEMGKMTVSTYIAKLRQELVTIPEADKKTRQQIERQIKQLRESISKDLSFNLPSNLKIPTLYEARRMGQNNGGGYQDNKVVTINLTANNAIDGKAAVETIVSALNGPPRVGVTPRMY